MTIILHTIDLIQQNIIRVLCSKIPRCLAVWDHLFSYAHDHIHQVMLGLFELAYQYRPPSKIVGSCSHEVVQLNHLLVNCNIAVVEDSQRAAVTQL